ASCSIRSTEGLGSRREIRSCGANVFEVIEGHRIKSLCLFGFLRRRASKVKGVRNALRTIHQDLVGFGSFSSEFSGVCLSAPSASPQERTFRQRVHALVRGIQSAAAT